MSHSSWGELSHGKLHYVCYTTIFHISSIVPNKVVSLDIILTSHFYSQSSAHIIKKLTLTNYSKGTLLITTRINYIGPLCIRPYTTFLTCITVLFAEWRRQHSCIVAHKAKSLEASLFPAKSNWLNSPLGVAQLSLDWRRVEPFGPITLASSHIHTWCMKLLIWLVLYVSIVVTYNAILGITRQRLFISLWYPK